ncbi:hypothetical protein CR513_42255, partial [Mucuna pruriens]
MGELTKGPLEEDLQKEIRLGKRGSTMCSHIGAHGGFLAGAYVGTIRETLGMPLGKSPPYLFRGHYPSWTSLAKSLKAPELEVSQQRKNWNEVEGIPTVIWGERLRQLQGEGDWLTFIDVYGLLVYDIVLFPNIEDYIDVVAINAFLGRRDQGEILANTCYTLNYCHEKNGRGMRCCTSLLYLWITAHLFHSKGRTECLIADHN